ncbi:hypothetical protein B0H13DRAFT_2230145 [Mycena leptocephala]|nr:hypothetical protein B0H13DRAFT_2230145 [Mycena leptocephala]
MCALFIGPSTVPSKEAIKSLKRVIVSKSRNAFYMAEEIEFSPHNLETRFEGEEGVPDAIELTLKDLRDLKATVVAWCLDRNNYVRMQSGSKSLSDRDPGFLTFCFPHLDPWAVLQADDAFQKDPNFAYVHFRTFADTQAHVVAEIQDMAPVITDLIKKWELNPNAKPSNKAQEKAMRTLNRLKCRRNEIRAMIKKLGTPALFLTLNPADIADPLLAALAGIDPEEWKKIDGFQRKVFLF